MRGSPAGTGQITGIIRLQTITCQQHAPQPAWVIVMASPGEPKVIGGHLSGKKSQLDCNKWSMSNNSCASASADTECMSKYEHTIAAPNFELQMKAVGL